MANIDRPCFSEGKQSSDNISKSSVQEWHVKVHKQESRGSKKENRKGIML
jgi:hypothetical protein